MKRVILVALSSFGFAFTLGTASSPSPSEWCPGCPPEPCQVICSTACPNGGLSTCSGQNCVCEE
jgi:hypothetical protein